MIVKAESEQEQDTNTQTQSQVQAQQSFSCCDALLAVIYIIGYLLINLCPIVAQIKAVYILVKYEKYLGNPDIYKRRQSHFQLMLNGYLFGYLLIYIPYKIIVFLVKNFDNQESYWKRHFAQTICGLIVFKILYEFFRFLINNANNSESYWKRHIAQTILGLIVFKILYEFTKFLVDNFNNQESYWKRHIAQTICGLIVFKILYEFIRFLVDNFNNPESYWKRNIAQTICGLVVFKIWYELVDHGVKWVYCSGKKSMFNLDQKKDEYTTMNISPLYKRILGYFFLTIASLGLYVPFSMIEIIVVNWFSEIFWKRHLSQLIGGLIVFKLWYETWMWSLEAVYGDKNEEQSTLKKIIGRIGLSICSAGLFGLFMIAEYLYWMVVNLKEPPYTCEHMIGVAQLSLITFGLYGIYRCTKSKNACIRYLAKILVILMNLGVYVVIYYFVVLSYLPDQYTRYVLIPMCLVNYLVYLIGKNLTYNEGTRYVCSLVWKGLVNGWWRMCHVSDHIKNLIATAFVRARNASNLMKCNVINSHRRSYTRLRNVIIPRMNGRLVRQPGDPKYIELIIQDPPIPHPLPVVRTWAQKNNDRFRSEKAINDQQLAMTIRCIECVIGYSNCMYRDKINYNPSTSDKFWSRRFKKITNNDTLAYKGIGMFTMCDHLFSNKFMPSLDLNKVCYDETLQHFQKYINDLKNLKKAVHKRNYRKLDFVLKDLIIPV